MEQFHPLGETDSEWAFCHLLDRLADDPDIFAEERFPRLLSVLDDFAEKLRGLGKSNFLLSEGRHLFAHGHTSLYSVSRTCRQESCDAPEKAQRVMLLATQPTTDHEIWRKLPTGRITVFRKGLEFESRTHLSGSGRNADSEAPGHISTGDSHEHFVHSQ